MKTPTAPKAPRGLMTRPARSAFTLIELLLVLVILAILAAIVVPKFTGRSEQARVARAQTDVANLETSLDAFEVDAGRYPTSDEGLNALVTQPGNVKAWRGPYIKQVPTDPWGTAYIYRYPGTNNPKGYDLICCGPDLHEGGGDDIDNFSQK